MYKCVICGDPILKFQAAAHIGCAGLEPCSGCEQWVHLVDMPLSKDARDKGFVRATRCPECGDEALHPPKQSNKSLEDDARAPGNEQDEVEPA